MASRNGKAPPPDSVATSCSLPVPNGPTIHGFVSTHGVANFLSVPYAHIPARFRTAQRLDLTALAGELDATTYGPRCPQPDDPIHVLMTHVFERLSTDQYTEEFSCLDVNIYAPPSSLATASNGTPPLLPVFAWIHGGAFRAGGNTTEFDGNHLVARSIQLGRPIVVVAFNYRLNILGYLTSREIQAEAVAAGETQPVRSQGLNDQKIALQWIQKHIGLFGGDAARVTVGGESAGAMSVHYLLHSKIHDGDAPLFSRALICSSPTPTLRTLADGQAMFDQLVQAAGVTNPATPYQVKLAVLRSYSAEKLIALVPDIPITAPFVDPAWFADWDVAAPEQPPPDDYWGRLPAWCPEVIVGHTKDEMALFMARAGTIDYSTTDAQRFLEVISPDPAVRTAIWETPSLQTAATPLGRLIALATDLFMKAPAHAFAVSARRQRPDHRVYYYSIDIVDPFPGTALDGGSPGPLRGFAWHSFGNPLLFYQPACQRDKELGITADKMTEMYLDLMYGKGPSVWEPFSIGGRRMSWNGSRSALVEVGFKPYDPVGDHLRSLGNAAWIKAYEDFKSDPSRLHVLLNEPQAN